MSEYPKSLFKTFEKLRLNLYKPLIFYIPRSIIPDDKKEYFKASRFNNYFNNVIIINQKGFDYQLKDQPSLYHIMGKQGMLDENIFNLLDKKETLNEYQFDFLLNKYLIQINFYVLILEWFNRNMTLHIENLSDEVKNSFKLQYEIFSKHLEQLKSSYFIKEKINSQHNINIVELIENEFPELNNIFIDSSKNEFKKKIIIKVTNKKALVLTDKEAEEFLLKTVFKVNN